MMPTNCFVLRILARMPEKQALSPQGWKSVSLLRTAKKEERIMEAPKQFLKLLSIAGTRRLDGVERSSRSMDAESRPCPEIKKASGSFLELSGAGIRVPLLCCPQRQYKLQLTPYQI